MLKLVSMLVLGPAAATAVLAGMYKWTDAEGDVHYGEHPPPGSEAREMQRPKPPGAEEVERDRERWDRIIERQERSQQLRREDRQRRKQDKIEQEQRELERKRLCARARGSLYALEQQRPVFTIDDKGERVFVDAERRATEIARLTAFIGEHCQ
jgi:hypothetical protein